MRRRGSSGRWEKWSTTCRSTPRNLRCSPPRWVRRVERKKECITYKLDMFASGGDVYYSTISWSYSSIIFVPPLTPLHISHVLSEYTNIGYTSSTSPYSSAYISPYSYFLTSQLQFHVLWDGAFQITGYMAILIYYIGWPALVGFVFMILAMFPQVRRRRKKG